MTIAPFNVEADTLEGGIWVFAVAGELDQATAPALREPLHQAVEDGASKVVIDMTSCGFIDSTGLGVIVEAWKALQARNGEAAAFAICCPEPEVRRLLQITGLDQAIAIRDTREEAIAVLED